MQGKLFNYSQLLLGRSEFNLIGSLIVADLILLVILMFC